MTVTGPTASHTAGLSGERADLLQTLTAHRGFLRHTLRGLADDQARQRTTVSELTLGGLVKHVAATEAQWADFIVRGAAAMADGHEVAFADSFRMSDDDTVAGLLRRYKEIAARTDALVRELPDLDASHPLPPAPWFEPGARWSARRVLLHLIAETSQHAGHADLLRESLDGAKTMG